MIKLNISDTKCNKATLNISVDKTIKELKTIYTNLRNISNDEIVFLFDGQIMKL